MKIVTKTEWSGVPALTTGECSQDPDDPKLWKVVWNLPGNQEKKRPLTDWFDQKEFDKYLKVLV